MKNAVSANSRKTTPPIRVTVRTEIRWATKRPPITARPVQKAWPKMPAMMTPLISSRAAKTIVANCDLKEDDVNR
jgi:hypothetical protein